MFSHQMPLKLLVELINSLIRQQVQNYF